MLVLLDSTILIQIVHVPQHVLSTTMEIQLLDSVLSVHQGASCVMEED
jgi:hypothetical protein